MMDLYVLIKDRSKNTKILVHNSMKKICIFDAACLYLASLLFMTVEVVAVPI